MLTVVQNIRGAFLRQCTYTIWKTGMVWSKVTGEMTLKRDYTQVFAQFL